MGERFRRSNGYLENKDYGGGLCGDGELRMKEGEVVEGDGYGLNELDVGKGEGVREEEKVLVGVWGGEGEGVREGEGVWWKYMRGIKGGKGFERVWGGKGEVEGGEE